MASARGSSPVSYTHLAGADEICIKDMAGIGRPVSLGKIVAGINFLHGTTWAEAVAKAKAENKLIFIDFYTQWCGPVSYTHLDVYKRQLYPLSGCDLFICRCDSCYHRDCFHFIF